MIDRLNIFVSWRVTTACAYAHVCFYCFFRKIKQGLLIIALYIIDFSIRWLNVMWQFKPIKGFSLNNGFTVIDKHPARKNDLAMRDYSIFAFTLASSSLNNEQLTIKNYIAMKPFKHRNCLNKKHFSSFKRCKVIRALSFFHTLV